MVAGFSYGAERGRALSALPVGAIQWLGLRDASPCRHCVAANADTAVLGETPYRLSSPNRKAFSAA